MSASSSRETPQSILAEVMERGRFSEEERRAHVQRMSRALLLEAVELMQLYNLDGESEEEGS